METVENLRNRITTAEELQSVVKTMKALSAVSIRGYEKAAEAVEQYSAAVRLGLQILLSQNRELLPGAGRSAADGAGIVFFGSDQGLCGPFNRHICEYGIQEMTKRQIDLKRSRLAVAGTRARDELSNHVTAPVVTFGMPASVDGITERVADILELVTDWLEHGDVQQVFLFHHVPLSGSSYRPAILRLFPFDAGWIAGLRAEKWKTRCLPAHFSDPVVLLRVLIRHYLFIHLYKAFAASLASEHAARLAAMQTAENSIEERLAGLQTRFHQARQAAITEELLDVVSGFEALRQRKCCR